MSILNNPDRISLLHAAEAYFEGHADAMSDKDVAQWTYLYSAVECLWERLHCWPEVQQQYVTRANEIHVGYRDGKLSRCDFIEQQEAAAMDAINRCLLIDHTWLPNGARCIDLEEPGATFFDDDVLHLWMVTGLVLKDDWCNYMPWSPEFNVAIQRYTMLLSVDEAMDVARRWHPGEWMAMHDFAETGMIEDFYSMVKELDEWISEAGDDPLRATSLYNLYAFLTIHRYVAVCSGLDKGDDRMWEEAD